jgi:hypothetical protein
MQKLLCENVILQALFQSAQHIYEKREGSGAGSGSVRLSNGSVSGSIRPKNMRIRSRIPNTAINSPPIFTLYMFCPVVMGNRSCAVL